MMDYQTMFHLCFTSSLVYWFDDTNNFHLVKWTWLISIALADMCFSTKEDDKIILRLFDGIDVLLQQILNPHHPVHVYLYLTIHFELL